MPKRKRHRGQPRALPVGVAVRDDGARTLEVGGVTQSVEVPQQGEAPEGYWRLMLPPECPRRVLLLGLGGGTIAHLLARRCPEAEMVGVDSDETVLALALQEFRLETLPHLRIEVADAFAWAAEHSASELASYDLICLDLFQGGRLAAGTLATAFLRQLAALLALGGTLAVNLMVTGRTPEHLHRLRRVFDIAREQRIRGNLVVHAHALPEAEISVPSLAEDDG
jgi:trans-aconitate methyltransferase